jgi:acetyltransferase
VAEFGLLVADDYQGKGLGTTMLTQLMDIGKREGVNRIFGKLLIKNSQSVGFLHRLGFTTQPMADQDGVLIGMKEL